MDGGPFTETEVLGLGEAHALEGKIRIFLGHVNFGLTAFISHPVGENRQICESGLSANDWNKVVWGGTDISTVLKSRALP